MQDCLRSLFVNDHKFSRELRLITPSSFKNVFSSNPICVGSAYIIVLAKANHLNYSRLGLAISKKSNKTAVGRNRIKRLIRESFRHNHQRFNNLDIVVISKVGIANVDNIELTKILEKSWNRLIKRSVGS